MKASPFRYMPLDCVVCPTIRSNARHFTARWKDGHIELTVPPCATARNVMEALDRMAPQLRMSRPVEMEHPVLRPGGTLRLESYCHADLPYTITLTPGPQPAGTVEATWNSDLHTCTVSYASDFNLLTPGHKSFISRFIIKMLHAPACVDLTEQACDTYRRIGVSPSSIDISRGTSLLGRCSADGQIHLSAALMLLPLDLRQYVICHEAAHLTHMDHSAAFHALVDRYTSGCERQLAARLRAFSWPIMRK